VEDVPTSLETDGREWIVGGDSGGVIPTPENLDPKPENSKPENLDPKPEGR